MKTVLSDRLLATRRDHVFSQLQDTYLNAIADKKTPVWLALGCAWVGLDLVSSIAAKEDHSIDCLIIPRVPFGNNHTNVYQNRMNYTGKTNFQYEIWSTMKMLKQGMGRLVRRKGVPPKTLYLLDQRLNKTSEQQYMRYFKQLFVRYQHVKTHP